MAVLDAAIIVLAFGTMGLVFGLQERAEWRRIVAWADAVLAHEAEPETIAFEEPDPAGRSELPEAA
jgi:hypothetical protein